MSIVFVVAAFHVRIAQARVLWLAKLRLHVASWLPFVYRSRAWLHVVSWLPFVFRLRVEVVSRGFPCVSSMTCVRFLCSLSSLKLA